MDDDLLIEPSSPLALVVGVTHNMPLCVSRAAVLLSTLLALEKGGGLG